MNFTRAKAMCKQYNAEVLSIHSEEENDFITAVIADKNMTYIGIVRKYSYSRYSY